MDVAVLTAALATVVAATIVVVILAERTAIDARVVRATHMVAMLVGIALAAWWLLTAPAGEHPFRLLAWGVLIASTVSLAAAVGTMRFGRR